MIRGAEFGQVIRFFVTACGGLILDLAVASALIIVWSLSDPVAALIGLGFGMVFNYFTHLFWTFRGQNQRPSLGHFIRFAVGVGVVLVVRIAVLWWLETQGLQAYLHPTVRLGIAAGLSFALSYLICSRLIFRNRTSGSEGLF
ncbi:GtrA family protein [Ruegeria sp.]|uniref:GtrA family protein n=1 Tax=Ruegeria sp. TaxID=1879320 RepID=UPI0023258B53|nr:GtrA family protein [Ruegeria sp.]MDA7964127.1 GtrA family protein [Ruegeria sp.]